MATMPRPSSSASENVCGSGSYCSWLFDAHRFFHGALSPAEVREKALYRRRRNGGVSLPSESDATHANHAPPSSRAASLSDMAQCGLPPAVDPGTRGDQLLRLVPKLSPPAVSSGADSEVVDSTPPGAVGTPPALVFSQPFTAAPNLLSGATDASDSTAAACSGSGSLARASHDVNPEAEDDEDTDDDTLDPKLVLRMEQFQRIPRLVPDLEFFFRYSGCIMLDSLLGSLCAPLKMLVMPHRVDVRDVMTVCFTFVGVAAFYLCVYPMDTNVLYSSLYHAVRTAATIKMYLLFSILEVSDRLLTSLTSDSLEILYGCVAPRPSSAKRKQRLKAPPFRFGGPGLFLGSLLVAVVSVALHSLVLLMHVVTLNVAINSEGNSLLALLISNNFVEVKSVVFKKYCRETLLQVCCADALERVQLAIFVCCMLAQHLNLEGFGTIQLTDVAVVVVCELLVDFVKHYFVATFNGVGLSLYRSFNQVLMFDVAVDEFLWRLGASLPVQCEDPKIDDGMLRRLVAPRSTFVSNAARRYGFVPMPYLAILLWCTYPILANLVAAGRYACVLLVVATLLALKACTHTYLVGNAQRFAVRSLLVAAPTGPSGAANGGSGGAMGSGAAASTQRPNNGWVSLPSLLLRRRTTTTTVPTLSGAIAPLGPIAPPDALMAARVPLGVSPQLTPMRAMPLMRRSSSESNLRRARSLPNLLPLGGNGASGSGPPHPTPLPLVIHISRVLMALVQVERFDVNAGKSKGTDAPM